MVDTLDSQAEDAMTPGRTHVKFMAAIDAVAQSIAKVLHELLEGLTLEDEQILNRELFALAPTQPQTAYIRIGIFWIE